MPTFSFWAVLKTRAEESISYHYMRLHAKGHWFSRNATPLHIHLLGPYSPVCIAFRTRLLLVYRTNDQLSQHHKLILVSSKNETKVTSSLLCNQLYVLLPLHFNSSSWSLYSRSHFFAFLLSPRASPCNIQTVECALLSFSSWPIWRLSRWILPSEYQADITERILFFCSTHTIGTTSRDLRKRVGGEQNRGWSWNDNLYCSLCIEYSLTCFIFCACICLFCLLLCTFFFLSSCPLASVSS